MELVEAPPMSPWADMIYKQKYAQEGEEWPDTAKRVATTVLAALGYAEDSPEVARVTSLIAERKFMPAGRYLYATGRPSAQTQNCALYRCEDSREGWADLVRKITLSLTTGAGVGVVYSDVRPYGTPISRGGFATGPLSPMQMVNEIGRHVMQGGSRRAAIWAGLHWWHADVFKFMQIKDWSPEIRAIKEDDFNFPAPLDMTNISVILDDDFFAAYHDESHEKHEWAVRVYETATKYMLTTAEPGFSVDVGENAGESLRNACTEITSSDDSDICNLGSLNLARFDDKDEFAQAVTDATLFLLAGTVYSTLPHEEIYATREKNRRIGLGLMGVHEWLLKRGYGYEPNDELASWLNEYQFRSDVFARLCAEEHGLSTPVKKRAIAPTGTIGIVGETTTGIEPIFCVAYKRRYLDTDGLWKFQYVVDPTAKRLVESGVDPDSIEDAYALSYNIEKRLEFQAWVQQWVDHGISSTINLPYIVDDPDEQRDLGDTFMKYLPRLRGVTVYPDGARGGQPLTAVPYSVAIGQEGVVFEETEGAQCKSGVCGA